MTGAAGGDPDTTDTDPQCLSVIGDYLVGRVESCTCDGPGPEGQHRSHCGWEPLAKVADILAAVRAHQNTTGQQTAARALRDAAHELRNTWTCKPRPQCPPNCSSCHNRHREQTIARWLNERADALDAAGHTNPAGGDG